jgi:hypothetical protein
MLGTDVLLLLLLVPPPPPPQPAKATIMATDNAQRVNWLHEFNLFSLCLCSGSIIAPSPPELC